MNNQDQETLPADHTDLKDRKVGLVFFGLVWIVIGGIQGLMAAFLTLMATVTPPPGMDQPSMEGAAGSTLYTLGFLAPLAIMLIWLGVGSIMARRWARDLSLVVGWLWLICGVTSFIGLVFFLPSFSEVAREATADPTVSDDQAAMIVGVMKTVMIVFQLVFFVVLPGIIVLFYRSKHVKATCERRDPKNRWTARCPLPVLALSVLLAFGAYQCIIGGLSTFRVLPVFGILLLGVPAAVIFVVFALVLAYLARGIYRLDLRAWWATVGLYILALISAVITFSRISFGEIMEAMGLPEQQLETLPSVFTDGLWMTLLMVGGGAVWLVFLWYLRRYFPAGQVQR